MYALLTFGRLRSPAMAGTPTRCGYCGRQTITRAGRCPSCGKTKTAPRTILEPPPAPSPWREVARQLVPVGAALALIAGALLVGSQVLLYLGILALCAIGVLYAVAHSSD